MLVLTTVLISNDLSNDNKIRCSPAKSKKTTSCI